MLSLFSYQILIDFKHGLKRLSLISLLGHQRNRPLAGHCEEVEECLM